MATGPIQVYNNAIKSIVNGTIDLVNDSIKVILLDSNHTFTATHTLLSDVSANELATQYGYTQQNLVVSGFSITETGGVTKITAYDPSWLVENSNLIADAAVFYSVTAGNLLLFSMTFSEQAVVPPGQNLVVEFSDQGIITFSA